LLENLIVSGITSGILQSLSQAENSFPQPAPGLVAGNIVPRRLSKTLLSIDALAETLLELGIGLDVHAFIKLVNQKNPGNSASFTTQKVQRSVHEVALMMQSYPVPPPAVITHVEPISMNAADREKGRKMLAAVREAFNNTVPMPYS